jgi:universal bacterial protein YeaZ
MRILAVDTSSSVAAVAVINEIELLGEFLLNHQKTHSQKLVPMIDELLKNLELHPEDIDVFAASSGPGSFTGLRIGITTVKAMAFALQKPVVSIPALDALAYSLPMTAAMVCPIMDARNNQVYTALYEYTEGKQNKLTEYMGVNIQELVQIIKGKNKDVIFIGDGVLVHSEYLKYKLGLKCRIAPQCIMQQKASTVAQLALFEVYAGRLENCFDMVPFYLRKPQAERELERKQQGKV